MINNDYEKIYENMKPGCFSAHGFLGTDNRTLLDIVKDDENIVEDLALDHKSIAARMKYLTQEGKHGLGCPVIVDSIYEVTVEEYRGSIPCPFSDSHHSLKENTQVRNLESGKSLSWTDLNIHMIEIHGFYEGFDSYFRINPRDAVEILGISKK